jgi:hypothetical protein
MGEDEIMEVHIGEQKIQCLQLMLKLVKKHYWIAIMFGGLATPPGTFVYLSASVFFVRSKDGKTYIARLASDEKAISPAFLALDRQSFKVEEFADWTTPAS